MNAITRASAFVGRHVHHLCATLLSRGQFDLLKHYDSLPAAIHTIAKGVNDQFSHIEV
jgi:hypothetical protein